MHELVIDHHLGLLSRCQRVAAERDLSGRWVIEGPHSTVCAVSARNRGFAASLSVEVGLTLIPSYTSGVAVGYPLSVPLRAPLCTSLCRWGWLAARTPSFPR